MKPKISIDDFTCTTGELLDEKGSDYGEPNNRPLWRMSDYDQGMISEDDWFQTISLALRKVCDVLCFDYVKSDWKFGTVDNMFHAKFYVDENNNQITEEEYAMWQKGSKRVWVCLVSVKVVVTETREIRRADLTKFGF